MPYSAAALTGAETTGFDADKPLLVVQKALTATDAEWTTTGDLSGSGDSQTDASFPGSRAHDDIGSLITKIRSDSAPISAASPKYFNFEFGAGISFDTLLILDHNFNSGGFTSVSLELADNDAFSSNVIEIGKYTVDGTTDNRILITNLNSAGGSSTYSSSGTAQRYSSVERCRLKIEHSGSKTPALGEVFLGTRYQLQKNPDVPWDNKAEFSETTEFKALSGLTRRYVRYRGQATRNLRSPIADSAEITVIEDWWDATEEGTRPFLYVETPSSAAKPYLMIMDTPALNFPLVGPFERVLAFSMTEQPPYLSRE